MRTAMSRIVVGVVALHGLIHLMGVVEGFGWADVEQLTEPISPVMGTAWLVGAVLVLAAAWAMAVDATRWWLVAGAAAVVSQALVISAWSDALAGTVPNAVLLAAAVYGHASRGPGSAREQFRRRADRLLAAGPAGAVVTEADLAHLPPVVATYVRRSGAVGQPRVTTLDAHLSGRIRAGADKPWMPFTGRQVNRYGSALPSRLFYLDATMFGLPTDVLHVFDGPSATMRAKVCSLVTVVDGSGPEMDAAETVTILNDLCILAPAALVDAPVTWQSLDDRRVQATYTRGLHTVTAVLVFDAVGDLVDFISDDRTASPDGSSFTPMRWSTPVGGYRRFGARRIAADGAGVWHAPDGAYTYLEIHVDDIAYDADAPDRAAVPRAMSLT